MYNWLNELSSVLRQNKKILQQNKAITDSNNSLKKDVSQMKSDIEQMLQKHRKVNDIDWAFVSKRSKQNKSLTDKD